MRVALFLILAMVLAACGGKKYPKQTGAQTDTTELHGNVAHVVLNGTVTEIHQKAEKFVLLVKDGSTLTIKVHPTIFIVGAELGDFTDLLEEQNVTVVGVQNPGIVKADTVWVNPEG